MHGAHGRQTGVHGDEQVEGLGLAHLADHKTVRSHAQRLLDQTAQTDLADPLEVGGPGLHGDAVAVAQGELEDLLAGDDALTGGNRPGQCTDHGGLPGLGGARDENVEPRLDRGVEEGGGARGQGAQAHEVRRPGCPRGVLADVDGPVPGGDGRDDDVEALAVGHLGVYEGTGQVEAAPRDPQHALDQHPQVLLLQDRRGQLGPSGARHEDPPGGVAPHLLDRVVVEVALEGPEARQGVDHPGLDRLGVAQGRDEPGIGAGDVVGGRLGDEGLQRRGLGERVDAAMTDELADLVVEQRGCVHDGPRCGSRDGQGYRRGNRHASGGYRRTGHHRDSERHHVL